MILIDTSVWIEFFNNPGGKTSKLLEKMISESAPLAINAIIEMEVLQGIRSDDMHKEVKTYLEPYQCFPHVSKKHFDLATDVFRACRKKGVTIRKSLDCLIAANCLIDEVSIGHRDRDFTQISLVYKELDILEM